MVSYLGAILFVVDYGIFGLALPSVEKARTTGRVNQPQTCMVTGKLKTLLVLLVSNILNQQQRELLLTSNTFSLF